MYDMSDRYVASIIPTVHIRWYSENPSQCLRVNDCCEYPAAAREIHVSAQGVDMGEMEALVEWFHLIWVNYDLFVFRQWMSNSWNSMI